MKFELTEHQIQTQLMSYLTAKGYYVMRMNSGKYSVGEGRNRRFVRGHDAGTPDLMAFKKKSCSHHACEDKVCDVLFIEVKRPKNRPTTLQKLKMEELTEHGATCLVIHSLEELQEQL